MRRAQRKLVPAAPPRHLARVTEVPDDIEWRVSEAPVPYEEALASWRRAPPRSATGTARECVWLLEHPPLFTAGTSADPAELFNPLGFPVYEAGRGGRYTYHGPGQRVGYVMLDLDKRGKDVRCFVHALEGWMIDTLGELGVTAHRAPGPHRHLGRRGPRRGEDRRARRAREALGHPPRICDQRRSRPFAFQRYRPVRDRRIWGHEPRRSSGNKWG